VKRINYISQPPANENVFFVIRSDGKHDKFDPTGARLIIYSAVTKHLNPSIVFCRGLPIIPQC